MASSRICYAICLSLLITLLLSVPAYSDDEEDHLLQGINSYRQSHNAPALQKNDKADCIADEIADKMEDTPCPVTGYVAAKPGPPAQVTNYQDMLKKCKINPNTTAEAAILPVCVSKRVATLVLNNYTQSPNSVYVNSTKYTGAGIGHEDDWTVVVLTTGTVAGSLASHGGSPVAFNLGYHRLGMVAGLFLLFGLL